MASSASFTIPNATAYTFFWYRSTSSPKARWSPERARRTSVRSSVGKEDSSLP